jgi:hypothetical protein
MRRTRSVLFVLSVCALLAASAVVAYAAGVPVEKGNAEPENFEPVAACGCHSALIDQWSRSMHAQALTDPLYLTKLEEAQKATNGAIGPFCQKCHGPAATMTGEIGKDSMSAGVMGGVNCSFCHQVVGIKDGDVGNTSHLVQLDGIRRAQIRDPKAPHPAAYSAFHESAEFCGGCHNVMHPVNGMHLEATYKEWSESDYAKEGVVCQDCHMSQAPGVVGPSTGQAAGGAPQRSNIYTMTFTGANVGLGNPELATAMLKSAATIDLEVPEVIESGASDVKVTITNKGAGHYLPTGLTEVREMWLEVSAESADGEFTPVGEHRFGTILQDDEGNSPVELWEATKIKSDDRIPPRESVTKTFSFSLPAGADKATLKAALLYRSAPEEMAQKAGVENPTTEMASVSKAVFSSEEARLADSQEQVGQGAFFDGMNLAVALLGMAAIVGLIAFFMMRSRKAAA